jgi:Fungal Zn(2)-Cys(6) binuclear cluster domain/Fungal specific transcription factor domain
VFKPNPSGRSKRACIACHAGKTKCDGNESCSACLKKGLECKYRAQDEIQVSSSPVKQGNQIAWLGSTSSESTKGQEPADRSGANAESLENSTELVSRSDESQKRILNTNNIQKTPSLTGSSLFRAPNANSLVDWLAVTIRNDQNVRNDSSALDPELEFQLDAESEEYLELYYIHFHHRWPLIHRPSLEEETPVAIVLSSMAMIGAWLHGSHQAKKRALDSHKILISEITSQLVCIYNTEIHQTVVRANRCAMF